MAKNKDSYVSPVMGVTESPNPWVSVWRFRAIMTVISVGLAIIGAVFVQFLNGSYQGQDPTFEPGGSNLELPVETSAPTTKPTKTPTTGNLGGDDGEGSGSSPSKAPAENLLGGPG